MPKLVFKNLRSMSLTSACVCGVCVRVEETLVLVQQALAEIYADRLQSMNEQAQLDQL